MELSYYINQIRFLLTGNILESELDDSGYTSVINIALQEVSRYYDSVNYVKAPGNSCIDLKELEEKEFIKIGSVTNVYRTRPEGTNSNSTNITDPMLMSQWNMTANQYKYGSQRWVYNYLSYNTSRQIANTISTDLDFKEDKYGKKLYINFTSGAPDEVTIEYIPRLDDVSDIKSDYWVDILLRLSLAYAKITVGRIRTRFTQSNAIWSQDGEKLLEEGNTELTTLRERLQAQANLSYPIN